MQFLRHVSKSMLMTLSRLSREASVQDADTASAHLENQTLVTVPRNLRITSGSYFFTMSNFGALLCAARTASKKT